MLSVVLTPKLEPVIRTSPQRFRARGWTNLPNEEIPQTAGRVRHRRDFRRAISAHRRPTSAAQPVETAKLASVSGRAAYRCDLAKILIHVGRCNRWHKG
ncbi:hypothetical protein RSSM_01658 [Rhodopirellula sallentina SM41]|uniref:Uncharacterized protein n=1 Tax=Rhodopirellula sallentina SM41 TaxID=1263870 RepID=M5ULI9_9BACT|nr:hypothetical protein RSSM_01658 [Rhodopirellula sallentina SM41]